MRKQAFQSRKNRKANMISDNITFKIDYDNIDHRDVYGFYLTNKTTKDNPKNFLILVHLLTYTRIL